jgi:hypothetical protein
MVAAATSVLLLYAVYIAWVILHVGFLASFTLA